MSASPPAPPAPPSPCTNVCRMDPASGWCEGCMRTLDEIAAWAGMSAEDKRQVWAQLPGRRERCEGAHPAGDTAR